ncbi:MAG TPA: phosphatase PAP2 family protein [Bryobacteraceae bacterium]|jgi:acid phosphatase (class A)
MSQLLFLIALLFPAFLSAQAPATPTSGPARKGIFVTPDQIYSPAILPTPPANESWMTLEELADLHHIEQTRTPAEIKHAQEDDAEESIFIFADLMGPTFNKEALPLTAVLSSHVKNDEGVVVNPAKNFFKRPRPYHLDGTLHSVCKTTTNREDYGYPSGHGTTGYLEALTLVQMVPEKRDAILARADNYAYSREVCGAHYASDEAASKTLAYAMMGVMMVNPQYKAELAAAKAETRAAFFLSPMLTSDLK